MSDILDDTEKLEYLFGKDWIHVSVPDSDWDETHIPPIRLAPPPHLQLSDENYSVSEAYEAQIKSEKRR